MGRQWLLTAVVGAVLVVCAAQSPVAQPAPAPVLPGGFTDAPPDAPPFQRIDLSQADWYVKSGFQPRDAAGFDVSAPGVVRTRKFPVDPFRLVPVPPGRPTYHFTLMAGFDLPVVAPPPLSLTLFFLGENWAVYLNGRLVRREIYLNPDGSFRYRRSMIRPILPLPSQALRPGHNTLVLHLVGGAPAAPWSLHHHVKLAGTKFFIGDSAAFIQQRSADVLLSMNWVYLFFALFYAVLYLKRPTDRSPLYFSLFAGLFAVYEFTGSSFVGEAIRDTTWLFRFRWLAVALLAPAMAAFMHTYFFVEERYPWQLRIVMGLGAAFALWFLFAPFAYAMAAVTLWQYQVVLAVPAILWTNGLACYRRRPYAWAMAVSAACFGVTVIIDTIIVNLTVYEPRLSQYAFAVLVCTLAVLIAIRFMELHQTTEAFSSLVEAQRDSFARFVPTQFLELLGRDSGQAIVLGDNSLRPMSVLFSDIRGFTNLSESMNPQQNFDFLNSYLKHMEPLIEEHGGFVDKFLGDGLMALFAENDDRHKPADQRVTSADRALGAAIAMQRELTEYNQGRANSGYRPIRVGIGINSGDVILGTVGSDHRLDTTVVGDAVNVASRLEKLAARFLLGIVISELTYRSLTRPEHHEVRRVGSVVLRGRVQPVNVYEVFDYQDETVRTLKMQSRAALEAALDAMRQRRADDARALLHQARTTFPADTVVERYLSRLEGAPRRSGTAV